ncbi:hypothetical protein AAF712_013266 [Marasmius tenuissimus]|uniref:Uncharacterized protein n=1 Tax=Marasmius tenuissimus TaxID=585030 RepID=A0ABR2ZE82_9AGAR
MTRWYRPKVDVGRAVIVVETFRYNCTGFGLRAVNLTSSTSLPILRDEFYATTRHRDGLTISVAPVAPGTPGALRMIHTLREALFLNALDSVFGCRYCLSLWVNGQMNLIALTSMVEAVLDRKRTGIPARIKFEVPTQLPTLVLPEPCSSTSDMSTDASIQDISSVRSSCRSPPRVEFKAEDSRSLNGSHGEPVGESEEASIYGMIGDDEVPRILFEPAARYISPCEVETSELGSTTDEGLMATIYRLLANEDDDTFWRGSIGHPFLIILGLIPTIQVTSSAHSDPDTTSLPLDVTQTSDLPTAFDSGSRLYRWLSASSSSNLMSPTAFMNEGDPLMSPNPPSEGAIPSSSLTGTSLFPRSASILANKNRFEWEGGGSSTCVSASARTGLSLESLGMGSDVTDWKVISPRLYVPSTLHSEFSSITERDQTVQGEVREPEVASQILPVSRVSLGTEGNFNERGHLQERELPFNVINQMQEVSRPATIATEVDVPIHQAQSSLRSVSSTLSWLQDITSAHDVDVAQTVHGGTLLHPIYAPRPRQAKPPFLNMTLGRAEEFIPRFTHHHRIPRSTKTNRSSFSWPPVPPLPPHGTTPTAYHLLLLLAEARRCFNSMADHPVPQLTASLYLVWEERWAIAVAYSNTVDNTPGSSVLRSLLEKRQLDGGNLARVWESPLWGLLEGLYLDGLVSIEETFV